MLKKDAKIETNPTLWFGSHESYAEFQANLKKAEDFIAARDEDDEDEKDKFEDMYERDGNVGVLKISGHLINGYAGPFFRMFGIIGYEDIAEAATLAAADRQASKLLLAVASPGGSVAGVNQASSILNALAKVKPMTGYTELAASAGYWLFSNAPYLFASETAITGSIGVIKIHREYSKMEEKEGITTTVMRAGKYKMLANPYEPLSEDAKAQIQSQLDDIYEGFIGVVAENRGTTTVIADQIMGQGREFIGKRGVEAGLVDALGSYNEALAYASRNSKLVSSSLNFAGSATAAVVDTEIVAHNAPKHGTTNMALKKTLTPEQIAAIAAGAPVDADASIETKVETKDEKTGEDADDSSVKAEGPQEGEGAQASAQTDNEIVAFLKNELSAAQTALAQANVQITAAASQVAALQEAQASLVGIVQASAKNLSVALGRTFDPTNMDAKALVEAYNGLDASFKSTFKVGKVAASTASTEKPEVKEDPVQKDANAASAALAIDPLFIHKIQTLKK